MELAGKPNLFLDQFQLFGLQQFLRDTLRVALGAET
jgi:hypothetical protein